MLRTNRLKTLLAEGKPAFGAFHGLGSPQVAELIGQAGCDFVLIDGEHGLGDRQTQLHCLQALAGTPASAVLRVPSDDPVILKQALDLGAEAIMVPNVTSAAQARNIVAACRYGPRGFRGYAAPFVRASDYGQKLPTYLEEYERQLLIIAMIESSAGVAAAGEIAGVDGIDVVQLGTLDLAFEMGVGDRLDSSELRAAVSATEAGVSAAGKPLGGVATTVSHCASLVSRGYRMVTVGFDTMLLAQGLADILGQVRRPEGRES